MLYKEELSGTGGGKPASANEEVKSYLKNQNTSSGAKLEFPEELLEVAKHAEKEGPDEESSEELSESDEEYGLIGQGFCQLIHPLILFFFKNYFCHLGLSV